MNGKQTLLKMALPAAVLLAAVGAARAMLETRPGSSPQITQPSPPTMQIVRVQPQSLVLNVASQGVVTPREEIDLVAEVGGKILRMHPALASGGFFEADDLLLTIDPRDYDYAIVTAQAKVAEAKRVLINERAQVEQAESEWRALGQGEASDLALHKPQLAEAEAKLQAAAAEIAKAKLDRGRCELRAPFAGRVLRKQAGRGQFLPAGSVIARIFATDVAEIRLPVGIDQLAFLDLPLGSRDSQPHWPKVALSAEIGGRLRHWQGRGATRGRHAGGDNRNPGGGQPMTNRPERLPGLLAWFAANPVAANLLMLLIVAGGVAGMFEVDQEVFPRFSPHQIEVTAISPAPVPPKSKKRYAYRLKKRCTICPASNTCTAKSAAIPVPWKSKSCRTATGNR